MLNTARGGGFSHFVTPCKNIRQNTKTKPAFTLAEVLVTLVIIGVVAAMTIPTLMASYEEQEAEARKKKFQSVLSQALNLAIMEKRRGVIHNNKSKLTGSKGSRTIYNYLDATKILKYLPVTETSTTYTLTGAGDSGGESTYKKIYVLNDGTAIIDMWYDGGYDTVKILFDTNGEKDPNTIGEDVFYFKIQTLGRGKRWVKVCEGAECGGEDYPIEDS
ncbi:MAG: type II secretion system GspH family protein [Candidatus Gastranaerophilales bacterium]|nr:type II secretion system GspH family protein [Candidatus Gastranaerophilales bacterium]